MTTVIVVVVLAAAVLGATGLWVVAGRRAERRARRLARLVEVVERIDAAVLSIGEITLSEPGDAVVPRPLTLEAGDGLPGRTALLGRVKTQVAGTRLGGGRLSAAVVRADGAEPARLALEARRHLVAVGDVDAYVVGPHAIALVLPGFGRADALGVLARIESDCPSSGNAVELEPGEDAIELVVRLLAQGAAA